MLTYAFVVFALSTSAFANIFVRVVLQLWSFLLIYSIGNRSYCEYHHAWRPGFYYHLDG
jgi:hypothetical protein